MGHSRTVSVESTTQTSPWSNEPDTGGREDAIASGTARGMQQIRQLVLTLFVDESVISSAHCRATRSDQ